MPVRTVTYLGGDMTGSPAAHRRYRLCSSLRGRATLRRLLSPPSLSLSAPAPRCHRHTWCDAAGAAANGVARGIARLPQSDALPGRPSHISSVSPAGLDAFVRAHMRIAHVPGLAACVVRGGDIVWAKGYGWANVARRRRVTPDTDFMLASVSKTVMATALMQLVQQGRVDLHADVDTYLPFRVRNPQHQGRPITPWRLLTHTSSIRDAWATLDASYVPGDSPVSLVPSCAVTSRPAAAIGYRATSTTSPPATPTATPTWRHIGRLPGSGRDAQGVRPCLRADHLRAAGHERHVVAPQRSRPATVAMPYKYVRSTGRYRPYGQYGYPTTPTGNCAPASRS